MSRVGGNPNISELGKATRFPVNLNPKKHPDGYLTCKLRKWLKKAMYPCKNPDTGEIEKVEGYDAVAVSVIKSCLKGDMRAAEILLDRLEGKPTQKIETDIKVTKMGEVTINNQPMQIEVEGENEQTNTDSPRNTLNA